ncbi:MAG: hypothetical protein P4L59_00595 [Desulfosporosinus sp.]|nr:hypothetical protein [Desulfosporosinus sp.]
MMHEGLLKRRCALCHVVPINTDTTAMKCVINNLMTNRHMVMGVVFAKAIPTIALYLILITKKENIEEGVLLRSSNNIFEMQYLLEQALR